MAGFYKQVGDFLQSRSTQPDMSWLPADDVPETMTFRPAWCMTEDGTVEEDLEKSKLITHDMRRAKRDAAFLPHDKIIALQIPGDDYDVAEAARVEIRKADDALEVAIDKCPDTIGLIAVIEREALA